jgi:hypothetical protein
MFKSSAANNPRLERLYASDFSLPSKCGGELRLNHKDKRLLSSCVFYQFQVTNKYWLLHEDNGM